MTISTTSKLVVASIYHFVTDNSNDAQLSQWQVLEYLRTSTLLGSTPTLSPSSNISINQSVFLGYFSSPGSETQQTTRSCIIRVGPSVLSSVTILSLLRRRPNYLYTVDLFCLFVCLFVFGIVALKYRLESHPMCHAHEQ